MATSNLATFSNLMPDLSAYLPEYRYLPGDYVVQVYPHFADRRQMATYLTPRQVVEHLQYLVCTVCGRPCAGTCT